MSKYVTVSTTNTWDTKYATVSNTWAIKDTVTSYFTKCTLCSAKAENCLFIPKVETVAKVRRGNIEAKGHVNHAEGILQALNEWNCFHL